MARYDWQKLLLIAIVGFVAYLVLAPLILLLVGSFTPGRPGDYSSFSLANYILAYSDPRLPELFLNSFVFAAGSVLVALPISILFAWLIGRTNTPMRNLAYAMVIAPMAIPGLLVSVAWVLILSPNIGIVNQTLMKIFGFEQPPFNIFTIWGMIFVSGLTLVPTTFLILIGAFRSMDPAMEEAASVAGAGPITIARRITLKLMMPAILVAGIYIFMTAIEAFEIPGVIGIPARIFVFSSRIYYAVHGAARPNYGLANALAITYLALSCLLIWIYQRMTKQADKFATVSGKAYRPRLIDLGKWKYLGTAFFFLYFFLAVLLPILILIWGSLIPFYQAPSREALALISPRVYTAILGSHDVRIALQNTLTLMVAAALIIAVLATVMAWVIVRSRFWGRRLLDILTFLPHAMPSIVIGLALIYVYLTLDFIPIYATPWILLVAFVTRYIAFGTRTMNAGILQLHKELEEAAQVSGASWGRILFKIIIPLLLPTMVGVAIWVAAHVMRELSMALMLNSPGNMMISPVIWVYWDNGNTPETCALGVMLIFALLVITFIGRKVSNRYEAQ